MLPSEIVDLTFPKAVEDFVLRYLAEKGFLDRSIPGRPPHGAKDWCKPRPGLFDDLFAVRGIDVWIIYLGRACSQGRQ